ncbi:TetR/AcrR family transcriptional regulator [Microbacter sp. GSS18]|nr:TetR/AcrR family transcriptional regulator [Microbacter sp. GSS18]
MLDAARGLDVQAIRLNDIARAAGVGVGTVYRHFPTVQALVEALATDTLVRLHELARMAEAETDPGKALEDLIRATVALQLEDGGLQRVLLAADVAPETRALRRDVHARLAGVLDRAVAAGVVRPDLTPTRVQHLLCGVEHAVRVGSPDDRDFYTDIALTGLRPQATVV